MANPSWLRKLLVTIVAVLLGGGLLLYLAASGRLGFAPRDGRITPVATGAAELSDRRVRHSLASAPQDKQILFGDLHVHTTFSYDAFLQSLPMAGGNGAHPPADACDFARYCAALDFWSLNDHAENLSPRLWRESIESIRQCNAVAGENPDTVAFLGWEWTQASLDPGNHYGHKNVVLRDIGVGQVPQRPISASLPFDVVPALGEGQLAALLLMERSRQPLELARHIREARDTPECDPGSEQDEECFDVAPTPGELFARLRKSGHEAIVIPHGTTWGIYTPPGSNWRKQLDTTDPEFERLIEVYSGHGSAEEFRDFAGVEFDAAGAAHCPPSQPGYLPSCQRAGEIIGERCLAAGIEASECERRAGVARERYAATGLGGQMTIADATDDDWRDAGQCRDCDFLPAFNYRPGGSVQSILALRDESAATPRFRLGIIASSDNHSARAGGGYKEFGAGSMTDGRNGGVNPYAVTREQGSSPLTESRPVDAQAVRDAGVRAYETTRVMPFLYTGGLVAVHAASRERNSIWDALQRREVYGTSGPRMLLWFDLIDEQQQVVAPMGADVQLGSVPRLRVRAAGSFEQQAGCPVAARNALGAERLQALCSGECYNPGGARRAIQRLEIVRIRTQRNPGEALAPLIEDPWRVAACDAGREVCEMVIEDDAFVEDARDTVYYARAVEAPSDAVNGAHAPCPPERQPDCLAPVEERAWSSPIFVDFAAPLSAPRAALH